MYESLISVALGCSAGMIPAFLASCVPKLLPPACNALRALTWCALPIHAVPDLPPPPPLPALPGLPRVAELLHVPVYVGCCCPL